MPINFQDEFWDLASDLTGTQIIFYSNGEPGWTIKHPESKNIIAINKSLSWKHKFFVLAHEAGHLFDVSTANYFSADHREDEPTAHQRAKTILDRVDSELCEEYVDFFNKRVVSRSK